jgi:uncharacterized protein (DUF362 family)
MRQRPLTRREFLRLLLTGGSAVALSEFLAACGMDKIPLSPTSEVTQAASQMAAATNTPQPPTATSTDRPTDDPTSTATQEPPSTHTPVPPPDLVVVHNGEPEELVRAAIDALGGMEKFVPKGANVIIKPNICVSFRTYEYAATTNPWVVGALVKLCYEAGAGKVKVMDNTWQRALWEAYYKSGIQKQVEEAGGEMAFMYDEKFIPTELTQGLDLKTTNIYEDILNAEVLINVPIAKHHADAILTLGMKNFLGVIQNRPAIHLNMGQRIADLNSRVRATLTVMDAVRMLMDWGPTGGALSDVKKMDTVIVSQDVVAVDSYTATLFDMQPNDLEYVAAATRMGLGRSDLANLRIKEFNLQ